LQYNPSTMNMVTTKSVRTYYPFFIQFLLAIGIAILLIVIISSIALLRFEVNQRGLIHSGVSMAGLDLSGLTIDQAAAMIQQKITFPTEGKVLIMDQQNSWLVTPVQLGFHIDAVESARKAYDFGRQEGVVQHFFDQLKDKNPYTPLSPIAVYDQRVAFRLLQNLAAQVDTPVLEANLGINGIEVEVNSGQIGRKVDINASLEKLDAVLMLLQDGAVSLEVIETEPVIMDVSQVADQVKQILSEPLTLRMPDEFNELGPWTISQEDLANLLLIERKDQEDIAEYQLSLDKNALMIYLTSLAPGLKKDSLNARYIFNDDTRLLEVIEPAVIGRTLNIDDSLNEIVTELMAGDHEVILKMNLDEPVAKDDTTGEELGITELVHAETSYFYGSDNARVQNIRAAASSFHGLLIPPQTTFSMGSALGDISLDNGYAEALIIVGNQTVKGVGGGVCQVSTTLFRAAFFAGFPVVERHAHAYRVSYYEKKADGSLDPNLAGLDATVYFPLVDMKFTNDTPYWLLMETYMGNYSLTWKFYSTKDGRSISWDTTGATNIVEAPDPLYRENPELAEGDIRQVDYAADGAYVRVDRSVYKDGSLHFSDTFTTQYRPWQAVFEYGPGTEDIPTPEPTPEPTP